MKIFPNAKLKQLLPFAAAAVVLLLLSLGNLGYNTVRITVNSGEIDYIVCYSGGFGPRRLDYSEHKDLLDDFFTALSGEYHFIRSWSNRGRDGGGPDTILFYQEGELVETVQYTNGFVCFPARLAGNYKLYRQEDKEVPFDALEETLRLYGKS